MKSAQNFASGLPIHMNGRVYSPETGRFLSPDPLIQAPTYSQSFNRYSYVWNNPLNNIDPSGYACGKIRKIAVMMKVVGHQMIRKEVVKMMRWTELLQLLVDMVIGLMASKNIGVKCILLKYFTALKKSESDSN